MIKQYKVGGHYFRIYFLDIVNDDKLLESCKPFETDVDDNVDLLFQLYVDDSYRPNEHGEEIGDFDSGGNSNWVFVRESLKGK